MSDSTHELERLRRITQRAPRDTTRSWLSASYAADRTHPFDGPPGPPRVKAPLAFGQSNTFQAPLTSGRPSSSATSSSANGYDSAYEAPERVIRPAIAGTGIDALRVAAQFFTHELRCRVRARLELGPSCAGDS